MPASTLRFTVNGRTFELDDPDPRLLLVDFLRSPEVGLLGTKLVCGEGGCGACTVLVSRTDPAGRPLRVALNSCLHPVCALDGCEVTTVEGVGSVERGLHPVQERLAERNGSQCGFCSPGWVMTMVGLLDNDAEPDPQTIENVFDGNLCRCTGYRPILNAMQSFASQPSPAPLPPPSLIPARPLRFAATGVEWHRTVELEHTRALMHAAGASSATTRLVNGNTSTGIVGHEGLPLLIDVSQVPELRRLASDAGGPTVGGGISLNELAAFLAEVISVVPAEQTQGLRALAAHLAMVANTMVRNVGTVAGNLVLARTQADTSEPFPSDLFTVLSGLGATATLVPAAPDRGPLTVPVLELPAFDAFRGGYLLTDVAVPLTRAGELVRTYKVGRRAQDAHALVNAAFRVAFDGARVVDATLVLGGIAPLAFAAEAARAALVGAEWTWQTFERAVAALRDEARRRIVPMPADGVSEAYRLSLAEQLFRKAFVAFALEVAPAIVPPEWRAAGETFERPVSSGVTRLSLNQEPKHAAIPKLSARIQAAGEARYTHDVPAPPGTLEAAYVYAERLHASFDYSPVGGLDGVLPALRERFPGVEAYVSRADVPAQNLFGPGGDDPVFADGTVTAYGQPIGLVLAPDVDTARAAAAWARANALAYAELLPVTTTIAEALALPDGAGLFQDEPDRFNVHLHRIERPGSDRAWLDDPHAEPDRVFVTGSVTTGAQSHFYLETQSALVVPGEPGLYTVHVSSQDLASAQQWVSLALGIPAAHVAVQVRRVGGGFGGKETRPPYLAAAAAVAARATGRPVRLVLDRHTDMTMVGTRHPYRGDYALLAARDGRIEKWRADVWSNGGSTYDVTFPVSDLVALSADGAYMVDTFRLDADCCRTNRLTRTAMRSFGAIQIGLVMEDAVEQAAHALGMLPEDVRERNLYADSDREAVQETPYGQPLKYAIGRAVWERLRRESDFDARAAAVAEFNARNRARKRGISMIPVKYGVSYTYVTGNQGGALLTVCETDGTVVVATGGVEMGQGLDTKLLQIASEVLGIDLALFTSAPTETPVVPNASSTGASTGTDLNGGAVAAAARELRARVEAWCAAHEDEPGFPDWRHDWAGAWPKVVPLAYADRLDLSASAFYTSPGLSFPTNEHPFGTPFYYFTWSAACSEVEIDCLTGQFEILRADVLYDAGISVNPDVDAGQIWGGFVQGIGNVTTEQMIYAPDGAVLSDGTWNYKPPCSKTIPIDFRIALLDYERRNPHDDLPLDPYGIQSSKSTGEPPLVLASSVFFAIKHAVLAARADAGRDEWFELPSPATVERIQQACLPR